MVAGKKFLVHCESHQAFHMNRMVSDARAALAAHHKRADLKPSATTPSITSLPPAAPSTSLASLPPNLVPALDRVSHLPLLLIEVPGRNVPLKFMVE